MANGWYSISIDDVASTVDVTLSKSLTSRMRGEHTASILGPWIVGSLLQVDMLQQLQPPSGTLSVRWDLETTDGSDNRVGTIIHDRWIAVGYILEPDWVSLRRESAPFAPDDEPKAKCPSAQPWMVESQILGVMSGDPENPGLSYLNAAAPATDEMLWMAAPLAPTEVFRLAARCDTRTCKHFDGTDCRLAARVVALLPTVTDELPPCAIRRSCRWHYQEGGAACLRCPQVQTTHSEIDDRLAALAGLDSNQRAEKGDET